MEYLKKSFYVTWDSCSEGYEHLLSFFADKWFSELCSLKKATLFMYYFQLLRTVPGTQNEIDKTAYLIAGLPN